MFSLIVSRATDVAKHLGEVLDSIQATIAFLERK